MSKSIDEMIEKAKELHPDLYSRAESIAKIIDPAAFLDGWIVTNKETQELTKTRNKYNQSVAFHKKRMKS